MEKLVEFLRNNIAPKMSLDNMVNVFENMCEIPIETEDNMILFETGIFSVDKKSLFHFSLVRQFSNEDEEYNQVHMEVLFDPTSENEVFKESTWDEDLSENIFNYIRKSPAFAYAKNEEYIKLEIYMDET